MEVQEPRRQFLCQNQSPLSVEGVLLVSKSAGLGSAIFENECGGPGVD